MTNHHKKKLRRLEKSWIEIDKNAWTLRNSGIYFPIFLLVDDRIFFSNRSRHTRWPRDCSSDVCPSDLGEQRTSPTGLFSSLAVSARTTKWPWLDAIGRASYRERVKISVVAVSLKKK